MNDAVALLPPVARLVASLQQGASGLGFPKAAVDSFRSECKGLDAAGKDAVVVHLLAWAHKAGARIDDPDLMTGVAVLVLELLGDAATAADAFQKAGFAKARDLVGRGEALRAPAAQAQQASTPVQARRGLSKKP